MKLQETANQYRACQECFPIYYLYLAIPDDGWHWLLNQRLLSWRKAQGLHEIHVECVILNLSIIDLEQTVVVTGV